MSNWSATASNQIDYHFPGAAVAGTGREVGRKSILTELSSIGDVIFEALQRLGLPVVGFVTSASTKSPLIENLALAFERNEWRWQPDPIWKAELEAYERTVSPVTGRSSSTARRKANTTIRLSRALMLWQAQPHDGLVDFA